MQPTAGGLAREGGAGVLRGACFDAPLILVIVALLMDLAWLPCKAERKSVL